MSISIISFMLFTTCYKLFYLITFVIFFIIFIKHIVKVTHPFIDPALRKNPSFIFGLISGALIFATVAGFISMVPYMMKALYHIKPETIGNNVILPDTISIIIF